MSSNIKCETCGSPDGKVRRLSGRQGMCDDCYSRQLETDAWAAQAIEDVLGATAKAALDHLAAEDIRRIVSEAVTDREREREEAGLSPCGSAAATNSELHILMGKRIAAREAQAATAGAGEA
ncbi:MAG TPA: hypothetical protein VN618_08125 [Solirubrobacteraceae bacterium]|nr:hypothetical protein [Solirubrobacteraceae bacterium]